MEGLYYKTVMRNQLTGYTRFYIVPNTKCEHLKNGLLLCEGQIGLYEQNTPIYITGSFQGDLYKVDNDYIPVDTEVSTINLLEYVTNELTECQMKKIASLCNNDLFYFVEKKECFEKIKEILAKSNQSSKITMDIINKVKQLKNQEELTKELLRLGIGIDKIELLARKNITMDSLIPNVYMLFVQNEIPIEKADMFASQNNIYDRYSIERLKGYVYYTLINITQSGNSCCTLYQLLHFTNYYLKKCEDSIEIDLSILNLCVSLMSKYIMYDFFENETYVYLIHVYDEELKAIRNIKRLQTNRKIYSSSIKVEDVEKKLKIKYNKGQKNAFNLLSTSGIKILTGPPGSGKTATINGLIEYFTMNNGGTIKLAATTGMAAKVMSAACNKTTETANIMLNIIPYQDTVNGKGINDPVDADLIIVDEVSMIGLQLFSILVDATKSGAILLLVGDENQLQSVDYGNILHDLIKSGKIETCRLTEIIRQSGTMVTNAIKINNEDNHLIEDNTFTICRCSNSEDLLDKLKKNIGSNKYQVLSPIKKSVIGTTEINNILQKKNGSPLLIYGKNHFYYHDKIIMTKTNYDKNYTNGDMGYVIGADKDTLYVQFVDKNLVLDRQDLCNVELAYAITIHKSQGSEFENAHIVLPDEYKSMLTKRILYTAVTRAKKKVYIYTLNSSMEYAISNVSEKKRLSLLEKKLKF